MKKIHSDLIESNLSPLISESFKDLGFISDNGTRYFRRNGNLVHYMVFYLQELSKKVHGARADGMHLSFWFGEFLTHTPKLDVNSSEDINIPVRCEATDPIVFNNKKHYKNAATKVIRAITQINEDRFSQVISESDYEDFHLRGSPSLEKIYHLTDQNRHNEVDAWLKLMTHEYRGFYCMQNDSGNRALEYYFDEPGSEEISFSKLSYAERKDFVANLRAVNIEQNSLGFLYETV